MKHLDDKATAIFRKLTDGLREVGDHQQWNNDSSFMAACVEIIGRTGLGPLVSIAQYWVHPSGDMMRDPDVVFVLGADQHVYSTVRINATSAGAAADILRAQYRGCSVNISWINEIR